MPCICIHKLGIYDLQMILKKKSMYVTLIRKEIDEFRMLFIDWVAGFDKCNYIWDEWELFNPPGAIPPNPKDYQDPINWDDFDED